MRHVFGIQGDYVLNFYNQLCKSPLTVINTCDEQGAGFAADGYARTSGFGVACVTYGVGGLKLANSTAQAFAEKSPVLVISGAPGMGERTHDPLLHHKIRSFETQLNVFREMTAAQAVLTDGDRAAAEINRVIATIKEEKRPGYIELPRDMVDVETEVPGPSMAKPTPAADQGAIDEALDRALSLLMAAHRPIILAGAEAHRFGLQEMLADFIDRSGLFFATGLLGKSVISEHHPKFIGVYAGAMSPDDVREAVEEADCIIGIGPFITDLSSGMFTQRISDEHVVKLTPEGVHVGYSFYPGIAMKDFLAALTAALPLPEHIRMSVERRVLPPFVPEIDREITMERLVTAVNTFLDDTTTVIAEAGDPLFGALDIRVHGTNEFMSPAYYASLGFAVPAAIAVQLAAPDRRPLALVGDGSFQMTGVEISTRGPLRVEPHCTGPQQWRVRHLPHYGGRTSERPPAMAVRGNHPDNRRRRGVQGLNGRRSPGRPHRSPGEPQIPHHHRGLDRKARFLRKAPAPHGEPQKAGLGTVERERGI